jgi:hypothetical protein
MPLLPDTPDRPRSVEDQAALVSDFFLAQALRAQLQAAGGAALQRGVCASCDARCLPAAVYCDADCRADHERALAAQARAGRFGACEE